MTNDMDSTIPDTIEVSLKKYWLSSLALGAFIFALLLGYSLLAGQTLTLFLVNKVFALDAMIMIGLSYSFSGLGYFFNFVDKYVSYRKYIGLAGFYIVLAHFMFSIFVLSDVFPFVTYYLSSKYINYFILGLSSLLILFMLTGISNTRAVRELGGKNWRRLLRLGYIAYIFALLHYIDRSLSLWGYWLTNFDGLPPLSLLVTIFAMFVLWLRLALEASLYYDRKVRLK